MINNDNPNNFEKDLIPLIEYAKWELFHFNSLKNISKTIKIELVLIDKDILRKWKDKSGYNIFKKQIFSYLSFINKLKGQKDKIEEENNKLNTQWEKVKSEKKLNLKNINELISKKDISDFFFDLKEKKINAYKNYEIISAKLYEIFKIFFNYKIKVDGLYNKGKLIIPLNYKNNSIQSKDEKNQNFLEIIYINKKSERENILYVFPNDIKICQNIENDIVNESIDNLINNIYSKINDQDYIKEFIYYNDDGNEYNYKIVNKKLLLNQHNRNNNNINTNGNKANMGNNKINQTIKNANNNINNLNKKKNLINNSLNNNINSINNWNNNNANINNNINENRNIIKLDNSVNKEKDIEKLRKVLSQKIKNLQEFSQKLIKKNNEIEKKQKIFDNQKRKFNEEKNKYNDEQRLNNNDNNNINEEQKKILEDLKNKCLIYEEDLEIKKQELTRKQKTLSDKEKFLQSYIYNNKNKLKLKENEYNNKKESINSNEEKYEQKRYTISSNNYFGKEDELYRKEESLKKKENELIKREKNLIERERKVKLEKRNNDKKAKELDEKLNELNDKLMSLKNKDFLMKLKRKKDDVDIDEDEDDEKELAKIQEELEEEINMEYEQDNKNEKKNNKVISLNISLKNNFSNSYKKIGSGFKSLSPRNVNKTNLFKEENQFNNRNTMYSGTESKITKLKNNNNNLTNERNTINPNYFRSNTIAGTNPFNKSFNNKKPTNNLNPLVNQTQTKINRILPSLGLERIGGPLNLNAVLQCFAHIPELAEGILELGYNKFFKERKNIRLSRNFATLVNNIFFPLKFNNNDRKYSPDLFVDTFNDMYPQDDQAAYLRTILLVKFIMETFHDELNIKKTDEDKDNKDSKNDIDLSNEKEVLVKFLTKITKNNNSLISKLFYGLIKLKCVCNECGNSIYGFDYYSFLFFDLLKVKKYYLNNKFASNKSYCLSLNDCLDYYNRPLNLSTSQKEISKTYLVKLNVTEKGKILCNKCQSLKIGTLYKSIYSAATILPIILERGNDENYYIDELKFPDELNLENYVEFNKSIKKYYLCGVVSNLGKNNSFGKFCAYCRMIPNGKWYCYKNESVSNCTDQDVHQTGVPYMVFYHKL